MFETIIVPLDGGPFAERALTPATRLAREVGAQLVTMSVVKQHDYDERRGYLERLTSSLDVPSRHPYLLVADDPAECVANAGEAPNTLVVMTSHARSGASHAVLGSVAERVVHELAHPVLVVGPRFEPSAHWPRGRVLVPLDGSETAEAILPATRAWCAAIESEAWMVSVIDASDDAPEAALSEYVRHIANCLEREAVRTRWDVVHGTEPASSIVASAADHVDLIAMATHGRTGFARITLGSVAARILHDATCPVLLVRPETLNAVND